VITARLGRRRGAALAALLVLAVLVQVTTVTRLPLPGPGRPDLVVLLVAAAALAGGPRVGAVCGFGAGLTLDLAPPADHPLGQWAFVACLLGYAAGLAAREARGSVLLAAPVAALAAGMAPLAFAGLGRLLGDPRASLGSAAGLVPTTLLWTLLLAPLAVVGLRRLVRGPRVGTWAMAS
jgi:rod shape-determining protein MreD